LTALFTNCTKWWRGFFVTLKKESGMDKEGLKLFLIIFVVLFVVMSVVYALGSLAFSAPIVQGGFWCSAAISATLDVVFYLFIKNCVHIQ